MKTLKRILFFIAGICLIIACSKSDHFWGDEPLGNTVKNVQADPVMITVPFKTTFIGYYNSVELNIDRCGEELPFLVKASGRGTATHLGNFTTNIEMCNSFDVFDNVIASFVGANGDEIYWTTAGQGFPPDESDPAYVLFKWEAPFTFTGGTGRFEGAYGGGVYTGYNFLENDVEVAHCTFEGTLTMVKGK